MGFIPAANAAQVQLVFTEDGQTIENVYHVLNTVPYDAGTLATLAGTFVTWWSANIRSLTSNGVTLTKVVAKALDTESAPGIEYTTGLPLAGTAASGSTMPNNVTPVITWVTGLRGRSYRGRTYHIGLMGGHMVGINTMSNSYITSLQTGYNALITAIDGLTQTLCVCSKYHNKAERVTCTLTAILNAVVNGTVDSQRRRLPGRGR